MSGGLVEAIKIAEMLAVFETSSPSYILLSSIDGCINVMKRESTFKSWNAVLDFFYDKARELENIEILNKKAEFFDLDKSKLVLLPKNRNGAGLADFLRSENIEPEMTAPGYVVCMTGAGDTKGSIKKLLEALFKAEGAFARKKKPYASINFARERALPIADAKKRGKSRCVIENAVGKISAGYVWAYPPGVPVLVPGEVISADVSETLSCYRESGISLSGNIEDGGIFVLTEE